MRILHAYKHYLPDLPGGIASAIAALVQDPASGNVSEVLTCAADSEPTRQDRYEGAEVTRVRAFGNVLSMPVSPAFPFQLRKRIRQADVVVLHHPFPLNDIGLFLADRDGPPIIVHWHAEILGRPFTSKLVSPFILKSLKRASRIIVSDEAIITHSPYLEPFRAKCVVLPYGIDYGDWSVTSKLDQARIDDLRQAYPRLIVAFGRLVPYKGFDVLIRAMASIDATLIIIGEGAEKSNLQTLARQTGVKDRIVFAGHLSKDQIKQHLHAANMFAFPSVSSAEAFGIAQLEAMAAGLPIINTDLPTAVPHIARHQLEALTVKPGDVTALSDAIKRLIGDNDLAKRLGAAAKKRVEEHFTITGYANGAMRIYEDAIAEHARTGR